MKDKIYKVDIFLCPGPKREIKLKSKISLTIIKENRQNTT